MEAKDLRIGNWIYPNVENATPYPVIAILEDNVVCSRAMHVHQSDTVIPYQDVEPIPLTPEILEKCGFDYIDMYSSLIGNLYFKITFGGNGLIFHYNHHCNPKNRQVSVLHLHQLQNLYYSLTGEELPIKI